MINLLDQSLKVVKYESGKDKIYTGLKNEQQ